MSSEAAQKAYPERVLPLYPEPPIGTWARDRFGGITYRQENGGWGQPGVMPFGKWEAMYDARGPYVETGPWGKPLGGGAMSTRDELVERIRSEANIASRPGQFDRLNAIADELAAHTRRLAERAYNQGRNTDPSIPNPYRITEENN